jgi:hypothetical protein
MCYGIHGYGIGDPEDDGKRNYLVLKFKSDGSNGCPVLSG